MQFVGKCEDSMNKLNVLKIQKLSIPGKYSDGDGLYLQVSKSGTKSWIFRYMLNGRSREMGLGPLKIVSLAEARIKSLECRKILLEGNDPIDERYEKRKNREAEKAKSVTFSYCAQMYIDSYKSSWRNKKHHQQWVNTIETYVNPVFGKLPVKDIDTALVIRILNPIWREKTETASRIRGRIEIILDWAAVRGYRGGENPARWRGHLDKLLPKRSLVQITKHHPALQINNMPKFMEALRSEVSISAKALEFLILTASRTSEVLNVKWSEIDLQQALWIVPAERMKAKKEHRVPLSSRAVEILKSIPRFNDGEYVFVGGKPGKPLSNMSLLMLLRRLNSGVTAHGFRSTFRDWVSEYTNHSQEVAEAALAHTIRNKVEAAYRRGDLFLKRRVLMEDWSKFCHTNKNQHGVVLEIKPEKREITNVI